MTGADDSFYNATDIATVKGLGPSYTASFYKKGIKTLFDLLLDFPFRYLDQTKITSIRDIIPNGQFVLIDARIVAMRTINSRVNILKLGLQDATGQIEAVFFNLYPNQIRNYKVGSRILAFGQVKVSEYNGARTMQQPTVTFLQDGDEINVKDRLTPVYHAVEKVPQASIRKTVEHVLDSLKSIKLPEFLPQKYNLFNLTFSDALELCHRPYPLNNPMDKYVLELSPSFKRICFEELIAYQLTLLSLKRRNEINLSREIKVNQDGIDSFIKSLPFSLTNAQLRSFNEISADMEKDKPMVRLLHGDVGSGKTMVAVLSMLDVFFAGFQSVLLAPTELLANQHFDKVNALLEPLNVKCVLLTLSVKGTKREAALKAIADGSAHVIIGTHAVFQAEVTYKNLALAVIDEQHRFGIDQRVALLHKAPIGLTLHQLVMTATPIPRTLQLALFSDLDVSKLDELPQGRKPITTAVMSDEKKGQIVNRLKEVCSKGTQVYWVCPNIEESEDETANVTETYKYLKKSLPNLKIGLVHGQLSSVDKNKVMKGFLDKKYDILVATTIIEVGVDVPNASIIIIEGADKLGLAQLHQLRGRVGRGAKESFCILVYKKNDDVDHDIAMQRLAIMKSTNDGFKIAAEDLKLRGPGEVLGQKQKGFDLFRVVDVNRDIDLIEPARNVALDLIKNDIETSKALVKRWFPNFVVH